MGKFLADLTPYGNAALMNGVMVTSINLPGINFSSNQYSFFTFHTSCKMAWITKLRMNSTKKPKCELDFEKEYEAIREKMSSQMLYMKHGNRKFGHVFQSYFQIQTDWVKPYLLEEKLGVAILQRCQRLAELGRQEQTSEHLKTLCSGSRSPPKYDSVIPSTLAGELKILHGEYWKHQENLSLLEDIMPINSTPVQEQMILRKHRDQSGRSYAWVLGQDKCAALGGCCGRGCGCCEKVLNQYLVPGINLAKETKEAKVLGHCTVECCCCIDYRGCYIPDSRLPSPVL